MTKKHVHPLTLVCTIVLTGLALSSCKQTAWPQFRGPGSDMIATGEKLPGEWGDSINIRWTHPMEGESWSSPIIYGNKVFITSSVLIKEAPEKEEVIQQVPQGNGNPPPPPNGGRDGNNPPPRPPGQDNDSYKETVYRWQLSCLDLKTGEELWKTISFEGNPRIKKHAGSTYACETPVTDGKNVFAYYGMQGVYCYDMNGKLIWEKDLGAYETQFGWGTGSSPVLYDNVLYILVDNEENSFIVALDALSGEEKWRKDRDEKTSYSTPLIWKNTLRTELVTLGKTARSYDPANGELLWELYIGKGNSVPSPVFDNEHIYLGNSGGPREVGGLYAIKAGAAGDITPAKGELTSEGVVWSDTLAGLANPSPVLHDGLIYILSSRGGDLSCFEAASGKKVYREKIENTVACWASPWINGDRLYFYDERGVTKILKTGREFELLGTNSIDDKFWASVAASSDAYIFKGVENIYCVGK